MNKLKPVVVIYDEYYDAFDILKESEYLQKKVPTLQRNVTQNLMVYKNRICL
jgi:hypothetical protein